MTLANQPDDELTSALALRRSQSAHETKDMTRSMKDERRV